MSVEGKFSDLEGVLNPVFCHLFLGLLSCCNSLWHIAQHEERLICSDAHKLTGVRPEDLTAGRRDVTRGQWKDCWTCACHSRMTHMFRLDLDTADQSCALPVTEGQTTV